MFDLAATDTRTSHESGPPQVIRFAQPAILAALFGHRAHPNPITILKAYQNGGPDLKSASVHGTSISRLKAINWIPGKCLLYPE
jgi:hypothetical protein